jgi:hypothetical protein
VPYVISCACGVTVQGETPSEVVAKAEAHQQDHGDDTVPVPRSVLFEMVESV